MTQYWFNDSMLVEWYSWKFWPLKQQQKIVLDINIFKKGGGMSWKLLDNHKGMGYLTGLVWSYAFMKEMAYLSKK